MWNKGYGIEGTYELINLETFADNITVFASGYAEMQRMTKELTEIITAIKLKWKAGREKDGVSLGPNLMLAGALRKKEGGDQKRIALASGAGGFRFGLRRKQDVDKRFGAIKVRGSGGKLIKK